jgi:hypothetical protein
LRDLLLLFCTAWKGFIQFPKKNRESERNSLAKEGKIWYDKGNVEEGRIGT